jgi:hypothetical protein
LRTYIGYLTTGADRAGYLTLAVCRQVLVRRESRSVPDDDNELIEFMLNTEAEDIQFEVQSSRHANLSAPESPVACTPRCLVGQRWSFPFVGTSSGPRLWPTPPKLATTDACCLEHPWRRAQVSRCRPRFTPAFFKQLDSLIGAERFTAKPDQERLAELETLRTYLEVRNPGAEGPALLSFLPTACIESHG